MSLLTTSFYVSHSLTRTQGLLTISINRTYTEYSTQPTRFSRGDVMGIREDMSPPILLPCDSAAGNWLWRKWGACCHRRRPAKQTSTASTGPLPALTSSSPSLSPFLLLMMYILLFHLMPPSSCAFKLYYSSLTSQRITLCLLYDFYFWQ